MAKVIIRLTAVWYGAAAASQVEGCYVLSPAAYGPAVVAAGFVRHRSRGRGPSFALLRIVLTGRLTERGLGQAQHHGLDRRIRAAVQGGYAQRGEGVYVHAGAAAFVLGEAVAGVVGVVPSHDAVAGHLINVNPSKVYDYGSIHRYVNRL